MKITDKQFEFISKEIEITYGQIDRQRESTTDFLKIYISIILGLFAYIYFIENRRVTDNIRIKIPNDEYIVFGVFGVIICLITFVIGWAILDNITKTVYKSIKHYKHISYLRNLISQTFLDNLFVNNSIIPVKQNNIPMRISAQVLIIGAMFNFGLLLLIYYFLSLFNDSNFSILFTTFFVTIISIFYANQLEKHFEEILIAQKLRPKTEESKLKEAIKIFIKGKKQTKNYQYTKKMYLIAVAIVLITILLNLISLRLQLFLKKQNILVFIPCVLFIISLIPRTYMGKHRIEDINCFQ